MNLVRHRGIGFAWRLTVAALLSGFAYWLAVSPAAPRLFSVSAGVAIWRVIEAPVAALNSVLPEWAQTVLTSSGSRQIFPSPRSLELLRYLAVGVPAYLMLLYLPSLISALWRRSHARALEHGV